MRRSRLHPLPFICFRWLMGRVIIRTARPTSGTCKQATATGRITTKTWCHCSSSVVRTSFYAALQHWHRWYNVPNIVDKPTNEQLGLRAQHHGTKGASESTRRCLHVMKFSGGGSQDLQSRARGILAPNSNGPEGPLNELATVVDLCKVRPAFQTVRNTLCGLADLFQFQLRECKQSPRAQSSGYRWLVKHIATTHWCRGLGVFPFVTLTFVAHFTLQVITHVPITGWRTRARNPPSSLTVLGVV